MMKRESFVLLAVGLAACGGGPAAKPAPAPASAAAAPGMTESSPGDQLIQHLQKRVAQNEGPAPGDAVVTFAVFSPEQAPRHVQERVVALQGIVEGTFNSPPQDLAPMVRTAQPRPELAITVQPVDEALPLNLDALANGAGDQADALRAAKSVIFVHYAGPPSAGAAHLRAVGVAVAALASDAKGVVADLGTLRTWSHQAWRTYLGAADWLADQVTVEAAREDDGTVVFFTRGMAKLGLPDLEQAGVAPDRARAVFADFQRIYAALRAHGHAAPGDKVGDVTLGACRRPAVAYDHECVGVATP
jgi:hypothetical protein